MGEKGKLEKIFASVYKRNLWGDESSISGPGSNLEQTEIIRDKIVGIVKILNIKTIVDAPCGDFFWMKEVLKQIIHNIDLYTGIDLVEDLVKDNKKKYESNKIRFKKQDLTRYIVPKADLIICRDCFLHLSYRNIYKILNNFKLSRSMYLLVSTYTKHINKNIYKFNVEGRPINLGRSPFRILNNLYTINENYLGQQEEFNDKSLLLIDLASINIYQIYLRILINEMFFVPGFLITNLYRKVYHRTFRLIKRFY